jgi:hypothetical protein
MTRTPVYGGVGAIFLVENLPTESAKISGFWFGEDHLSNCSTFGTLCRTSAFRSSV